MPMNEEILKLLGGTGGGGNATGSSPAPINMAALSGSSAGNSLLNNSGAPMDMAKIIDLLRRMTAFNGGDSAQLLALLNGIIGGGNGGGGGTGGGGGNGDGCLHGDTPVNMADGTTKPAKGIQVDDVISGQDFAHAGLTPQTVTQTWSSRQVCRKVSIYGKDDIVASESHRWFVQNGNEFTLKLTGELVAGDVLYSIEGKPVVVKSISKTTKSCVVYFWTCEPDHSYYAGGVLHHNANGAGGGGQLEDPYHSGIAYGPPKGGWGGSLTPPPGYTGTGGVGT